MSYSNTTVKDFPENWRYIPLRWYAQYHSFIPVIKYKTDKKFGGDKFRGFSADGRYWIGEDDVSGCPAMAGGAVAWSRQRDCAVGVMPAYCDPPLAVVDCDSDLVSVPNGKSSVILQMVYGIDQLSALCQEFSEEFPRAVTVRSASPRHGHLYCRQNSLCPVRTTKIKPRFLSLDLKTTGFVVHWTAPGRELLSDHSMLGEMPEIPVWLARYLATGRSPSSGAGAVQVRQGRTGEFGAMYRDAALAMVKPNGQGWNQALFNAACCLAEAGMKYDEMEPALLDAADAFSATDDPGRKERRARSTIASAWQRVTGERHD